MTVLPCVRQGYEVDSRLSDIQLQRISEITTKQFRAIVLQTHHSALSYYVLKISKLRLKIVRTLKIPAIYPSSCPCPVCCLCLRNVPTESKDDPHTALNK